MAITAADAAHLLRRTGYGVAPAVLDEIMRSASRAEAVDRVLDVSGTPAEDMPEYRPAESKLGNQRRIMHWWFDRMRTTPAPIVEKMTMFWHNHFVSALGKVPSIPAMQAQQSLFRRHAVGNYHDLVQAISIDPAMLVYLDNWVNVKWKPQENFARELMELFTLGVGTYTEQDVVAMAKAWTGHSLSPDTSQHRFYPKYHDAAETVLFGLPARNWDGPAAITEILRGVKAVESSEFIAAKVFSAFAFPVGRDHPVVPPIAAAFRDSGLDLLALLRAVLLTDEFWSESSRFALVRSPIEWMVAGMQALGLSSDTCRPANYLVGLGQVPFNHPGVDGWKLNDDWLSTSVSWGRSAWASDVRVVAQRSGVFAGIHREPVPEIVERGLRQFGIVGASPRTRTVLEDWATRTLAEGDAYAMPANLVQLLLLSPEFQIA